MNRNSIAKSFIEGLHWPGWLAVIATLIGSIDRIIFVWNGGYGELPPFDWSIAKIPFTIMVIFCIVLVIGGYLDTISNTVKVSKKESNSNSSRDSQYSRGGEKNIDKDDAGVTADMVS